MMPTLTGTLADVTGGELDPADIRSVSVRAPAERPSMTGGDVLIVSAPVDLDRSGVLSVALETGPAVLVVVTDASHDVYELHVTADMTLLSEAVAESAPAHERSWVESVMVQLRAEAVAAAGAAAQSATDADGSADAAGVSASAAAGSASDAASSASAAASSASDAGSSATAAAGSASDAADSAAEAVGSASAAASSAGAAAGSASDASQSALDAASSASAAAGSASTAAADADRAETAAAAADASANGVVQVWSGAQWIDADKVRFDALGALQEALVWDAALGQYVTVWPVPPLWVDDFTSPTLHERWTLLAGVYAPPGFSGAAATGPVVGAECDITFVASGGATVYASSDPAGGTLEAGASVNTDGSVTFIINGSTVAQSDPVSDLGPVTLRRSGGQWSIIHDGQTMLDSSGSPMIRPDTSESVPMVVPYVFTGVITSISYTEL